MNTINRFSGLTDVLSAMEAQRQLGGVSEEFWAHWGSENQELNKRDASIFLISSWTGGQVKSKVWGFSMLVFMSQTALFLKQHSITNGWQNMY